MAGFSDTFENDLLGLIFKGVAIANIADNAATAPLTNLFCALHTADPGEAGTQATSEATYTGYARVSVARGAGWNVTGNVASPAANISFPLASGGTNTLTHFSIGVATTGATKILASGALTTAISVTSGTQPVVTTATTVTLD